MVARVGAWALLVKLRQDCHPPPLNVLEYHVLQCVTRCVTGRSVAKQRFG